MARFLARLSVEVRGGSGATPPEPAAPFKLAKFNNEDADGLAATDPVRLGPLVVVAQYTASRDVTGTDALDAIAKVMTFANLPANVPALVPPGGRIAELTVKVREWPT
jgi:molybdopterin biosynthesis enzyme